MTAPSGNRTLDSFVPGSVGLRPMLRVVHLGRPARLLGCNKEKRRVVANRFKDSKDPFRTVIVRMTCAGRSACLTASNHSLIHHGSRAEARATFRALSPSPSAPGWERETWNLKPGTNPHA